MTSNPVCLGKDTVIQEAARQMRERAIGDVIVTDGDRVCGVVTDRDIVLRAVADGRDLTHTPVGDICSPNLVTVRPDDDADQAVRLMREHAVRRLPVIEDHQPVGVVSIGDLAVEKDRRSALADISAAPPNA